MRSHIGLPRSGRAEALAACRPTLDNGLALEGLDEHDAAAVVAGLCVDLVDADPGAAVRARARVTLESPGDLHEPDVVSAAYLVCAAMLRL